MKKILVTGGAGFIGTNLIKRLVSQGYKVTSYDNYTTGKKENHIIGCDYHDVDITTCTFEVNFDIVFHMAAIARIQPSFKNPKEYFSYDDFEEDFENFMTEQIQSGKKFMTDDIGSKGFREKLQSEGHDGILIARSTTDTGRPRQDYVVFDPKNIRSQFAKFDPTKADSRDILAGVGYTAFGALGALSGLEEGT